MKIKRFQDKDTRRAMARIRAEMGADAVILSNKSVNGQVELVAAIDLDETTFEESFSPEPAVPQTALMADVDSPTLIDLQQEMSKLRTMLETELSQLSWRDMAGQPPIKSALFNRLSKLGLSKTLSGSLLDKLPPRGELRELWIKTLGRLARKLSVTGDSLLNDGGIVALVGSTGVGKTTTIAKLAARFVMRHGSKQVALITTDCYRIGGQEQLETFAKYLDIPVVVATDGLQLKAALDQFSSRKLVLIDTAGMSQRDIRLYEQFTTLNSVGYDIDSYVVLSATAQQGSLNEVINVFGKNSLAGAMITKLDESANLGGLLDAVVKNNLTVGYVSTGQKVPEDIMPARAEHLVAKAVELMDMEAKRIDPASAQALSTHSIAV